MPQQCTKIVFRYSVLTAAVLGACTSLAQGEEPQQLPQVTVTATPDIGTIPLDAEAGTASRLGIPIKDMPASVEIVTQETMRERGDRTTIEAVEKTSGFTGGYTPATPGVFSVRGFSTNGVAILYNGVRVPGGTGMSNRILDIGNYDRIEVLRGPASVLYGEGAIGAAVNFISKEPTRSLAPVEVDYSYGSFNSHRLHAGTGGPVSNSVAYRFDASASDTGSHVKGNRSELSQFTGSLLIRLAPTLDLTLEVDHARDKQEDAYWGTPLVNGKIDPSLRDVNYNNLDDNRFESDTTWLRANLAWNPSDAWALKNYIYSYDSTREWRNVENYDYNTSTNNVTRSSWGDVDHKHEVVGDRVELLNKGKLGNMDNRLVLGADINRTRFDTARNGFPSSPEIVDPYNPPSRSFNNVSRKPARDVSIDQWSLFLEDQLALTAATKLVVGARYDRVDVDWIYYDQAGAPRESKTHNTTSYRAGLVHDLTPNLTLYGSYATAIEPGGTLLLLNRNQSQLGLTEARQWETGLKQTFWSGGGAWSLALYDIEKRNVFVPDPVNPSNRIPVGKQSSTGGEITLALRPSAQWKIDANHAYVRARFGEFSEGNPPVSRNGNTPPLVPKSVTNLGVRYLPIADWELGAWARHVDKVYTDNANTTELPSYTTLDLNVDYQWRKGLGFSFRVRNVTDELYANWAYRAQQVTIAEPRTFEISMHAKF